MTVLVWYRNDLRVTDHGPLAAALASGEPVRALWLRCDRQWDEHEVAPARRWYVLESLRELGHSLARLGVPLELEDCGDFASVPALMCRYARRHGVTRILCNREYPLNEVTRDRAVVDALAPLGVTLEGHDDSVLVPPRVLRTGKGTPYTVFTPYRRAWDRHLAEHPPVAPSLPSGRKGIRWGGEGRIRDWLEPLAPSQQQRELWAPGEGAARGRLLDFVRDTLSEYARLRDYPARDVTSRLSVALSAGTLSPRTCYRLARDCAEGDAGSAEGARVWISELAWRDFYRQIMAHYPRLARGEPFRREGYFLHWSRNEDHFHAWSRGMTGYPLVDAAMRQLNETGWMHNRLRMLVAMFFTKHLFQHWNRGERYFMRHLVDGDFAANNGGWLWSASLGTDAVPYFRVFNPVRQSRRFDPEGTFIRARVPELAGLDGKQIHEPWKCPRQAPDYPEPVVSLEGVRERVSEAFRQASRQAAQERRQ